MNHPNEEFSSARHLATLAKLAQKRVQDHDLAALSLVGQKLFTFACTMAASQTFALFVRQSYAANHSLATVGWGIAQFIAFVVGTGLLAITPEAFSNNRLVRGASYALTYLMLTPVFVTATSGLSVVSLVCALIAAVSTHLLISTGQSATSQFFQPAKQLARSACLATRSGLAWAITVTVPTLTFMTSLSLAIKDHVWFAIGAVLVGTVLSIWAALALTRTTEEKESNYLVRYIQLLFSGAVIAYGFHDLVSTFTAGHHIATGLDLVLVTVLINRLATVKRTPVKATPVKTTPAS